MSGAQLDRFGAGAGIAFVVILVVSFIVGPGQPPAFEETAEDVAAFVGDNRGAVQAGTAMTIVAAPLFIAFLVSLVGALWRADGAGSRRLAIGALVGGTLTAAFALTGWTLQWAVSYHGELDAGVVQGLWDASRASFLFVTGIGFVILIGASSAVALATGILPRVVGAYGAALAAFNAVVAFIATFQETGIFSAADGALLVVSFLGSLLWILLVSGALAMGAEPTAEPAPARA